MATNDYYFLDKWFIPHPVEQVWPHILNAAAYPGWWGEVYDRVEPLDDLPPDRVGAKSDVLAHGRLPYQIHFVAEVTQVEAPYVLGLKAEGDLTGTGLWTLSDVEGGTAIAFEWIVRADKVLLRVFSPILKPIFAWNHRWTMQKGEAALKRLLSNR
ncbi:MAG: SRPBCC family protein [Anaerolineae bacterium]|nr:SRPBCC family protein [Anaerolineae bacterium]